MSEAEGGLGNNALMGLSPALRGRILAEVNRLTEEVADLKHKNAELAAKKNAISNKEYKAFIEAAYDFIDMAEGMVSGVITNPDSIYETKERYWDSRLKYEANHRAIPRQWRPRVE